ncbi:MFS transporter [Myxococcota bacterium]|nr:MFS transporter [Myxococcota bacterium]
MATESQPEPGTRPPRDRTATWVGTTYFAEGLPYMLVRYLSGVYLTDLGFREAWIGLLNLLGIPWNLKFLWAPAVDLFGTRRGWLTRIQGSLVAGFGLLAALAALGPLEAGTGGSGSLGSHWTIPLVLVLLVALAFLSATHDIAIDGYYMEAIPDPTRQAAYTGLRVMTYRFAVIFTKSVLVAVAGYWTWSGAFLLGALTLLLLLLFHVRALPRVEAPPERRSATRNLHLFGEAFLSWLRQERVVLVLAFIATYKLGDEVLFSMNTPFLIRELGVSKAQLSWLAGVLGTSASIAGSLVSAWAIRRFGLRRAIWPLTLAMNLNLWAYVWLAWTPPDAATTSGISCIAAVHAYEQFAAGLGNAVLVVFIMRICLPRYKAAHYAIASAISSVGSSLFGGIGGYIVEAWGYVTLFVLAFVAALPSMAILLVLKIPEERPATDQKT